MKCATCGKNPQTLCAKCGQCTHCTCVCWTCPECKQRFRQTNHPCRYCGVCGRCCQCRKAPNYLSDNSLGIIEKRPMFSQLPRSIGVELEIANWKNLSMRPSTAIPGVSYNTSHDWSVKPSETEMVLKPLRGDAIIRGMLGVSEAGITNQCELNDSCALHVHVGAKDLSYWEIRRLLEVYVRVEGEIYSKLIAPHRRELPSIHYCQMLTGNHNHATCDRCRRYDQQYPNHRVIPEPIEQVLTRMRMARSTEDLKICLFRMLYGIENPSHVPTLIQTRKGGHYEYCRYFGLNLHSWMHRTTVEWRMKEATFDPWEMVFWPLWCGWMVHAVTRMSDVDSRSEQMSVRYVTEKYMPKYFGVWLEKHGV